MKSQLLRFQFEKWDFNLRIPNFLSLSLQNKGRAISLVVPWRFFYLLSSNSPSSPHVLSSRKLVDLVRKAIIIWSISWQILECTKLWGADYTVRNPPFEVKVPCNLVKESLSFSNLVFSSLCSSYLWRICISSKTTGKKAERNSIKHSFEGSKPLHRT